MISQSQQSDDGTKQQTYNFGHWRRAPSLKILAEDVLRAFVIAWSAYVVPALAVAMIATSAWRQCIDARSEPSAAAPSTGGTPSAFGAGFQPLTLRFAIIGVLIYLFDAVIRAYALPFSRVRGEWLLARTSPASILLSTMVAVSLTNLVQALRLRTWADDRRAHDSLGDWLIPLPGALLFAVLAQNGAPVLVTLATVVAIVASYIASWRIGRAADHPSLEG